MDVYAESLKLHEKKKGKLSIVVKTPLRSKKDLSLAYTPGAAEPCKRIAENVENVYKYTNKGNMVAVISDGSAVLGLGNLGAAGAIPLMEGKAVLFKELAGIDAFPLCLDTQDPDEIVKTIRHVAPVFGGINLEDIAAPRCYEVESRLQDLGIPVMHDDQHGTAVVVLAALMNALKVVKKDLRTIRIAMSGAGAAGSGVALLLLEAGVREENMLVCDRQGIIARDMKGLDVGKKKIAHATNPSCRHGSLADAMRGADVFIGVSVQGLVSEDMVRSMNKDAIVFAMANPEPEIMPDAALRAGARVVATGRSDFPNQVNNALVFPGVFRGALDARASRITPAMKVAAAKAIAVCVKTPSAKKIIPDVLDKSVTKNIARAVMKAWKS